MEPISLILTALATAVAAGVTKGATDTATSAIKDSYDALKGLIKKKFVGKPVGEIALAEHEKNHDAWKMPLQLALTEVKADQDEEIIKLAKQVMEQVQARELAGGAHLTIVSGTRNIGFGAGNSIQGSTFSTGDTTNQPVKPQA
jgi:hypothetical protein